MSCPHNPKLSAHGERINEAQEKKTPRSKGKLRYRAVWVPQGHLFDSRRLLEILRLMASKEP